MIFSAAAPVKVTSAEETFVVPSFFIHGLQQASANIVH